MKILNSKKFIQNLIFLSEKAGGAILEIYHQYQNSDTSQQKNFIKTKNDNSPLTIADLKSNQILLEGLKKLTSDIPVVSEEDESSWIFRKPDKTFWIIDPLDGTKEFLNCSGEFTVNIGLVQNSKTIFGMIFSPVTQEILWGGSSYGSYKSIDDKISEIFVKSVENSIKIIASKSHLTRKTVEFISNIKFPYELIQSGSSLKFCRIAEGKADIYPRFGPTCEWDTAAGQAILEGAGGFVQTEDGNKLLYGKSEKLNPNFIASNQEFSKFLYHV